MNKKFLVIGNWKANLNLSLIRDWFLKMEPLTKDLKENSDWLTVSVAPSFPFLSYVFEHYRDFPIQLAAQDASRFENGRHTGEVTAQMLSELGVKNVIIGHSERRKFSGETNPIVEEKMKQAVGHGIVPIIGAQSDSEIPDAVRDLATGALSIMFEPFESISTDQGSNPVSPEVVESTVSLWSAKFQQRFPIIYGGSVEMESVKNLVKIGSLSGVVVGQASLDASQFGTIIKNIISGAS